VVISKAESELNCSVFSFSLLLFALYILRICFSNVIDLGFSDVFMAVFLDGHEQLPPHHHHLGWKVVFHRLASPGVSASAIRRTPPRLQ
jgi:hypothetical protein